MMSDFESRRGLFGDDHGAATVWWIFWMIVFLLFGGVAVDSSNAWRMQAELQSTADAAAHAGVIDLPNSATAAAAAKKVADANMKAADHGIVVSVSEIEFGAWSKVGGFAKTPPGAPPSAVRVTARRDSTNANPLQTYFLRLVGVDRWDVAAQAVAERYWPICLNEDAVIARRVVDLQSNNVFRKGLCIHGNSHVEVNNNNVWETGVKVTMPSLGDFVAPSSDWTTHNPGLADALGEEWFDPKIVDQTTQIMLSLLTPGSANLPGYIGVDASGAPIAPQDIVKQMTSQKFSVAIVQPGHVYHVTCPGNSLLNFGNGVVMKKAVIVTECRIATGNNSYFEDVILASLSGDKNNGQYAKAINIGQGNQMGKDDDCAKTGNVKLFSNGSIHSAAGVQFYGVQAVAKWAISLAAQAQGLEGIQLLAGNDVDISSNNAFGGGCSGGVDAILVPYYRLVM